MKLKFLIFSTVSLVLFLACNNASTPNVNKALHVKDSLNDTVAPKSGFETNQLSNDEIKSIFTIAIKDYIETVYKKDKIHFDTLYFGKHVYGQSDDFPDIELPTEISGTQIILIDPETGNQKQQYNNAMVYINMMGWVDKVNASFILVTFSNGGQHQFDYFIDYDYNVTTKKYQLKRITLEDYHILIENKPRKINIYSDGKYTF